MAVKKFVFRENWVGSKVAGTKTTFFAIFDPTYLEPHFDPTILRSGHNRRVIARACLHTRLILLASAMVACLTL